MRVLVCGSRTFGDSAVVDAMLDRWLRALPRGDTLTIVEGGARGADHFAHVWASGCVNVQPVLHEQYRANWDQHGKAAGIIRNRRMLNEGKPDVVFAFTDKPLEDSRGTLDMVTSAREAGVRVYHVQVLDGA